jgi:hypothetical protein
MRKKRGFSDQRLTSKLQNGRAPDDTDAELDLFELRHGATVWWRRRPEPQFLKSRTPRSLTSSFDRDPVAVNFTKRLSRSTPPAKS